MIRLFSMLFILLALVACSTNKTALNNDCQCIDENKIILESRQMNELEMKQFNQNYPMYKESVNQAIKDINAIRDKLDLMLKEVDVSKSDLEELKNAVSDTHYNDSKTMTTIDYKNRINEIKDKITEIEQYLQKACCP